MRYSHVSNEENWATIPYRMMEAEDDLDRLSAEVEEIKDTIERQRWIRELLAKYGWKAANIFLTLLLGALSVLNVLNANHPGAAKAVIQRGQDLLEKAQDGEP